MAAFYYDVIMFYIELIYTFSAPFDHEEKKARRKTWLSFCSTTCFTLLCLTFPLTTLISHVQSFSLNSSQCICFSFKFNATAAIRQPQNFYLKNMLSKRGYLLNLIVDVYILLNQIPISTWQILRLLLKNVSVMSLKTFMDLVTFMFYQ